MKKFFILIGILFISVLVIINLFKPKSEKVTNTKVEYPVNNFTLKYAGNYQIEIKGQPSGHDIEMYVLSSNGKARWYWINNEGVKSEKFGNWLPEQDKIKITIVGNTGKITEEYFWENGKFIDSENKTRFLKYIDK